MWLLRPLTHLMLLLVWSLASANNCWNFGFDEQLVTHQPNDANHTSDSDEDVTVLVPRPGAGRYVGLLTLVTNWPAQLTNSVATKVSAFLGIPYAAKPEGSLRFRLPQPAYLDSRRPWVVKSFRPACLQYSDMNMSPFYLPREEFPEDCLYLNLFVPGKADGYDQTRLPVLAHIHGGSFFSGSLHLYPGQVLAAKGIVVATIAYRLGVFGFLSTGDQAAPGNFGLWDQRRGLMWLRDNVQYFGGDPSKVTLSGESAGAASVGLHILSSSYLDSDRRPLFHQAVMMSGADISNWAIAMPQKGKSVYTSNRLASELNCSSAISEAMVDCLRYKHSTGKVEEINSKKIFNAGIPESLNMPLLGWPPVVDGALVDDIPLAARQAADFMRMPIMGGFTRDDGARRLLFYLDIKETLSIFCSGKIPDRNKTRFVDKIYDLYFDNAEVDEATYNNIVERVAGDYDLIGPVYQVLHYHARLQQANQSVFMYEFQFEGPKVRGQSTTKVKHGDETKLIFGIPFVPDNWWPLVSPTVDQTYFDQFNDTDQRRMSDFMMTMWTNFVKHGDPTPEPVNGFKWDRLLKDNDTMWALLNLPEQTNMTADYKAQKMQLWKEYYEAEMEYILNSSPKSGNS